jgi:hypothetical protein
LERRQVGSLPQRPQRSGSSRHPARSPARSGSVRHGTHGGSSGSWTARWQNSGGTGCCSRQHHPVRLYTGPAWLQPGYRVIHRFMISPDLPHRKPLFRRKIPLFGHRVISCWPVSQIEVILANGGHFEQISRIAVRHIIRKNAEFGKDGCKFIRIWLI